MKILAETPYRLSYTYRDRSLSVCRSRPASTKTIRGMSKSNWPPLASKGLTCHHMSSYIAPSYTLRTARNFTPSHCIHSAKCLTTGTLLGMLVDRKPARAFTCQECKTTPCVPCPHNLNPPHLPAAPNASQATETKCSLCGSETRRVEWNELTLARHGTRSKVVSASRTASGYH
jgi:hypothetical protein